MELRDAAEPLWLTEICETDPPRLRPTSTVQDVIEAAIAQGVNQFLRFAPGVRLGSDAEDVHKSRVATRKMRSQLKSFSVALEDAWLRETRSDLGWLAGGLGAVRDADIMIQRIRRRAAMLPSADEQKSKELLSRVEASRYEAAQHVSAMIGSSRCRSLVERLRSAAAGAPVLPIGREQAREVAPPLVSASWQRLQRSVDALPRVPSDDDLHEVRIRAKRCRYTTEILVPVMGGASGRLVRALSDLQGILGEIHDSHCTQTWLRASPCSTGEALAAGMMIAAEAAEHQELLASWRRVWERAQEVKL